MTTPKTNRDLYLALGELGTHHKSTQPSLEQYLLAVLRLTQSFANQLELTMAEFYHVLSNAFTEPPLEFAEAWRSDYERLDDEQSGYEGWRAEIIRQIVDLREMAEDRSLEDEQRYFGISSPRGRRWFNFEPAAYLECAMDGSLGGWEPEDDTGREFVPGKCAVFDSNGKITTANPQDLERPIFELERVSWDLFKDFIYCGRIYE